MMKRIYLGVLSLLFAFQAVAQNSYEVSTIPKDLLPRASAVVRSMEMNIEVKSLDDVTYRVKQVLTVLNSNGDDDAAVHIWYNKSRKVKSVKGVLYDELGKPYAKFSDKQFVDVSASGNSSLFEDSRMKIYKPNSLVYPYTIECEYEIDSKQSLNFPEWYPNRSTGVAVEYAVLNFVSKNDFNIRYKEVNYPGKPKITSDDKTRSYQWEVKDLKAFRYEPYSPLPETFLTSVRIAPEKFSYEKIKGSFTNWHEYGKWVYDALLKDRDQIPEPTATYILEMTANIDDPKEKAKKIYEFMQQKTRYVSIQIGIGGYQPFLASEVDKTGYGDCKALVNYTQGLLKVAGITSHYVVVASGDKKQSAYPDFASMNQFDHAILSIPFENDTVWVDCTSKENPFGFLGTFTDDRLAVACTAEGGQLVRTPKFEGQTSQQVRKASFKLDDQGAVYGNIETVFDGWQYDNRDFVIGEPMTEQLKKVPEIYRIDNLEIESFKIDQEKGSTPKTVEKLNFKARGYGAFTSDLMYVPVNRVNQSPRPQEIRDRQNELYINRGYVDIDRSTYELPESFKIESLPRPVALQFPFGKFEMNVQVAGDKIHYTRHIAVKQGVFPPEQYAELVKFYRAVAEADAQRFILKKVN